ncbi:MAG: ferritin-like domain-containing protein [Sciscionella sp.]|nr:ferritin-like domain-containing protein [Sciscionella sp.]
MSASTQTQTSQTPTSATATIGDAMDSTQQALGTEHAAIWMYGLASAFVGGADQGLLHQYATAHRALRDQVQRLIADNGGTPNPAEPAYVPPKPVTDASSAMAVLITAENDGARAWRAVLEHTDDQRLRSVALDALTGCAVRGTAWRQRTGQIPSAQALPGTQN